MEVNEDFVYRSDYMYRVVDERGGHPKLQNM
jgi:hypothetical protein